MIGDIRRILVLPHLKVHNANALSSPYTIGFPAITAFLGAIHALQRKLNSNGLDNVRFNRTGIISHEVHLQTYKGSDDFFSSIILVANPLNEKGERSSIIEEARCHLEISFIIEYSGITKNDEERFIQQITHHLNASVKMAGGDILSFNTPFCYKLEEGNDIELRKLIRELMPGYAIIERRELIVEAMKQGQDAMDAILDYLVINNTCQKINDKISWSSQRKTSGWLVPVATGFQSITEPGEALNQRDPNIPHSFAESSITLGEFKMLHRINSLDEILWHYHVDLKNHLYLCQQTNPHSI